MRHIPPTLVILIGLSGCVHTEITQQTVSTSDGPYRKLVVCSLSDNPENALAMDVYFQKRLHKHHVDAQTCEKVFPSTSSVDSDMIASSLLAQGYEGVLVFQPQGAAPEPDSPSPSLNANEFSTLEHFWTARQNQLNSVNTLPKSPVGLVEIQPLGKTRVISGVIKLLSVKEDRIAWATGGTVEGSEDTPVKEFIKSVVDRTEDEMTDSGIIPEK